MYMPKRASQMVDDSSNLMKHKMKSNWRATDPLRTYQNKFYDNGLQNLSKSNQQRFNNEATKNHMRIEGLLENLGDIYSLRKQIQSQKNQNIDISEPQSRVDLHDYQKSPAIPNVID